MHYRGDAVTLGQDREDDFLGPRQARGTPEGPQVRGLQTPHVGVRHKGDGHPVERQRGDQRADGPLTAIIGDQAGETAEGALARLRASG